MTEQKNNKFKKFIRFFWFTFFAGVLSLALIFFLASKGYLGYMPDFEVLENPESNLSTQIFSTDGKVIGKFYLKENRTPIRYDELSPYLIKALIATEDERYHSHSGIDFRSLTRAIVFMGKKGGGSTITQQLSKLLFHKRENANIFQRIKQKIKEQIIAVRLEKQYTKNEIIAMYLNQFDWLNQGVGIKSASRIYFNKEPANLKIEEAATLVGMLKNPAYFRPISRPERTLKRRNVVLYQMAKNGYITQKEKDSLQKLPLKLDFTPERHDSGMATYLREYIRKFIGDWAKNNPKEDGSKYNIYTDGLKIYTTIDSRLQANAEEAVKAHMKNLQAAFDKQNKKNKYAPFNFDWKIPASERKKRVEKALRSAMKRSERWRVMKKSGLSDKEIEASFHKKIKMRVFSYKGDIDTLMTPYDSIRYYKRFLHAGLMSMEPTTGHIKAWVGGVNFKHFKYDHVKQGARQVGSTFKQFICNGY
jgi:penicillin-binding protein 1A